MAADGDQEAMVEVQVDELPEDFVAQEFGRLLASEAPTLRSVRRPSSSAAVSSRHRARPMAVIPFRAW